MQCVEPCDHNFCTFLISGGSLDQIAAWFASFETISLPSDHNDNIMMDPCCNKKTYL